MPRNSLSSVAVSIFCLSLISCDPCANLDCISDNYFGQFRIVNKTDGRDLVFGTNALYDLNQIMFFSTNGTDTTFFEYAASEFRGSGYDSILLVRFYPQTTTPVYMKLDNLDTDTLTVSYNTFKTKCCGTITKITGFKYNNIIDIPGEQGTQELGK